MGMRAFNRLGLNAALRTPSNSEPSWRVLIAAGLLGFAFALAGVAFVNLFAVSLTLTPVVASLVAGTGLGICLAGITGGYSRRFSIKEQNKRLDGALNNMNQGLCMFDAEDGLVVWNQRYIDMYRIDPARVWVGCTVRDLLDARTAAGTFPLDIANYEGALYAALKQGKSFTMTIELADGRIIAVVNQPMEGGGWVATHEDITERQRAERDLEHTRAFLDSILENVPSPIIVKDVPGLRYLLVNRAAEKHLGIDRGDILGKTAHDVMPPHSAESIEAEDQKVIASGRSSYLDEQAMETPGNGTRIVTTTRLAVPEPNGKPQYLITVIRDVTERKRDAQRIAHMAQHDALTDLPNRAAFNQCISATVDLAAISKESFAVLCIDLDRFKTVNDVFGHAAGDALLRELAVRLEAAAEGAFVARTGGDEFIVISPTGPQPETAEALAERFLAAVSSDIEIHDHALRIGLTIGIAIYPQDGADASCVVANADAALYRAKSEARGSIRFFEAAMDRQLRDKRALQQDLRTAIARNELALHYQPQARIDGEITGFEALARWQHPRHGMVPPNVFIPLAEESGSIMALGEWALRAACREAASWPKPLTISINLSPVQFRHGDLPTLVHEVLLQTGLTPGRLELEITEGVLIGDFTRAVAILRRLKNLGVRIAMDDFGTGYSSLSYLQSFPFDKIKIDKAFIANVNHNEQAATIVRAVIALSRGLSLPVVAEGVETEEQLRFLASEACDGIQGYYVGRPKPISEYAELVGRAPFGKKKRVIRIAS